MTPSFDSRVGVSPRQSGYLALVVLFGATSVSAAAADDASSDPEPEPPTPASEPPEKPQRPGAPLVGRRFGMGILMGGTWGGDELAVVDNTGTETCVYVDGRPSGCDEGGIDRLSAGDGFEVSLAFRYTPLWIGGHGFGIGARVGILVAGNDPFTLIRFPIVPEAHAFIRVADPFYFLLATGPVLDLGARFKFDNGVIEQTRSFDTPIGFMVEVGPRFLWTFSDGSGSLGIDVPLRYTMMSYTGGEGPGPAEEYMPAGHSFSANRFGIVPDVYLSF